MSTLRTFVGIAVLAVILYSVYVWISRNPKHDQQAGGGSTWSSTVRGWLGQSATSRPAASPAPSAPGFAAAVSGPSSSISAPGGAPVIVPSGPPYASPGSAAPGAGVTYPVTSSPDTGYPSTGSRFPMTPPAVPPQAGGVSRNYPGGPGGVPARDNPGAGSKTMQTLRGYFSTPATSSGLSARNGNPDGSGASVNPFGSVPGFASVVSGPSVAPATAMPSTTAPAAVSPAAPSTATPAGVKTVSGAAALAAANAPSIPNGAAPPGVAPPSSDPAASSSLSPAAAANSPAAIDDFQSLMQAIQTRLDAGQLSEAHVALSKFYQHPRLAPDESRQLTTLLDQVAGTVVYSRQHHLEPAYRVQPGDSLDRIAATYNVPAELLAKINGIREPQNLAPGTELKVVRGPFDAIVDLSRYELTLVLHDRYAGRFPVGVGREPSVLEGQFTVREKKVNPTYYGDGRVIAPGDPANPLGDRMLDLGGRVAIHGTDNPGNIGRAHGSGAISLSSRDIHDVYDILSVGSRVTVRR